MFDFVKQLSEHSTAANYKTETKAPAVVTNTYMAHLMVNTMIAVYYSSYCTARHECHQIRCCEAALGLLISGESRIRPQI